jgi:hypothetical protein
LAAHEGGLVVEDLMTQAKGGSETSPAPHSPHSYRQGVSPLVFPFRLTRGPECKSCRYGAILQRDGDGRLPRSIECRTGYAASLPDDRKPDLLQSMITETTNSGEKNMSSGSGREQPGAVLHLGVSPYTADTGWGYHLSLCPILFRSGGRSTSIGTPCCHDTSGGRVMRIGRPMVRPLAPAWTRWMARRRALRIRWWSAQLRTTKKKRRILHGYERKVTLAQ